MLLAFHACDKMVLPKPKNGNVDTWTGETNFQTCIFWTCWRRWMMSILWFCHAEWLLRETVLKLKTMLRKSLDEAWNHPNENFCKRWRAVIMKELDEWHVDIPRDQVWTSQTPMHLWLPMSVGGFWLLLCWFGNGCKDY
jgi:hypothetical protein